MDFFAACDRLMTASPTPVAATEGWEKCVAHAGLSALPQALADYYTSRLSDLYTQTGSGNPLRDALCHMAAQCLHYTASPWVGTQDGAFLHLGELESWAFLSTALDNWRVPFVLDLCWHRGDAGDTQSHIDRLFALVSALRESRKIGAVEVIAQPPQAALDHCAKLGRPRLAMLHVASPPGTQFLLDLLGQLAGAVMAEGVILVSGDRALIHEAHQVISSSLPPATLRLVDTTTYNSDGTTCDEALLVIAATAPPLPYRELGAFYTVLYEQRAQAYPRLQSIASWPVQETPLAGKQGIWEIKGGATIPPRECFATWDLESAAGTPANQYSQFSHPKSREEARRRWQEPFGRVLSLPNSRLIGAFPLSADGILPLESMTPYHLGGSLAHHQHCEAHQLSFPSSELTGEWLWLPCGGGAFSHWLIEHFLPAVSLKEMGVTDQLAFATNLCNSERLYLQLAGFDLDKCVVLEKDCIYHCEQLWVPLREETGDPITSFVRVHHPLARQGIEAMLDKAGVDRSSPTEKLYVSRLDARHYRGFLNEEDVVAHLRKRGYRIVNGSTLSAMQALEVYGRARVIAGPLGAGMLNAVFAPAGCQVVALTPPEYYEEHIEQVCHLMGHDYAYLGCTSLQAFDPQEGGARNSNFVIDLRRLDAILDLAEARSEERHR